jgi:hypothetical protein
MIYFDSFNRSNSSTTPGTADSGQAYSTLTGYVQAGISSNALYQPDASNPALSGFDLGLREFETIITVGSVGTGSNYVSFVFAGSTTESLSIRILSNAIHLYTEAGVQLATASATVSSATPVTLRVTKKRITVRVSDAEVWNFPTTLYEDNTQIAFAFPAGSTATVNTVKLYGLNEAQDTVSDIISEIRELYDETDASNSYTEASPLLVHFNRTLKDLTARTPVYQQKFKVSGVGDSEQEHAMPGFVSRVSFVTDGTRRIHQADRDARFTDTYDRRIYTTGLTPRAGSGYWINGDRIGFEPALGSADVRYVYYASVHPEVSAEDTLEIPDYCRPALVVGTLARLLKKERDPQAADYIGEYENEIPKIRGLWNRQYSE